MRHRFTWDDDKAEQNHRDHGVSFDEAADAFYDPNRVELFDEGHSEAEARYIVRGFSKESSMKKTAKKIDTAFQPTSQARVIPRNRRTEMAPAARQPRNIKVRTNIHLDLDVIRFFIQNEKLIAALARRVRELV